MCYVATDDGEVKSFSPCSLVDISKGIDMTQSDAADQVSFLFNPPYVVNESTIFYFILLDSQHIWFPYFFKSRVFAYARARAFVFFYFSVPLFCFIMIGFYCTFCVGGCRYSL